jgi:hypothetical protein
MGTKPAGCADSQCGDWTSNREYSIFLPQNYNPNQAYPLIFAGPGCGGGSANIDRYDNNVNDQVIVIGLKPSVEIQAFNAISPNQGCFDDHEGDDSVDWVFYEDLYDTLASTLCFDRNRVFAGGNNSGATLANELGCKYAGDAMRPIRGVISNQGGLPSQAQYEPTCTDKPMAGFWAHFPEDTYRFPDSKFAINRAISVNHCIPGTSYDNATLINYPIGGGLPDDTCKQIAGCDELMVVCSFPGSSSHQGLLAVTELGGSTFLQSFMASATQ